MQLILRAATPSSILERDVSTGQPTESVTFTLTIWCSQDDVFSHMTAENPHACIQFDATVEERFYLCVALRTEIRHKWMSGKVECAAHRGMRQQLRQKHRQLGICAECVLTIARMSHVHQNKKILYYGTDFYGLISVRGKKSTTWQRTCQLETYT